LRSEEFYWDLNDDTRAFSKRFRRNQRVSDSAQAACILGTHYLKSGEGRQAPPIPRRHEDHEGYTIKDMFAKNGRIR